MFAWTTLLEDIVNVVVPEEDDNVMNEGREAEAKAAEYVKAPH